MEVELMEKLQTVGYTGTLVDPEKLNKALELGGKSCEFTELVSWICEQLSKLNEIDETVHSTSSADDSSSFLLELSFFLKELGCVNTRLMTGNVNQRLANRTDRIVLLEYLISELMASQILQFKCPKSKSSMEVTLAESDSAKCLREMLMALKFQKPPENVTPELLFTKLQNKLNEIIGQVPADLLGKAMFFGELSTDQWNKLNNLQQELHKEYTIRREMLLKRLDVTVQSFLWSERTKPYEDELNRKYSEKRDKMLNEPNVAIADLLAARDDLAIIEKTSNAVVRKNTRSKVNTVMIGVVPDRGGRPYEQEPPPPEMPPWQKDRVAGPPSRGGYRGGGRGGQSGRGGSGGGGGGGGRGGGGSGSGGGHSGGYRDSKSVMSNFGQNAETASGYGNRGGGGGYQGGGYQDTSVNVGYQRGGYQQNRGGGGHQGGGYYDNRGSGGGYESGGYQDTRGNRGYHDSGYQGNVGGGNYQTDHRGCSGYQDSGHQGHGGSGGYQRGGGGRGGRGSRVQGGWNQGGGNYQRGGYNRAGQNQYR